MQFLYFFVIEVIVMIKECNFKSKIRYHTLPSCWLTPPDTICPGEDNCIFFQIYKKLEGQK